MFLISNDRWEERESGKKGKGIFATKPLEAGVIIGDYTGKVIPMADENDYGKDEHLYLMYYSDEALIYPDLIAPGIHLLNHSCTPNCWMYTYKGHTLFFTLRKIFPGEELTVSYLLSPLDKNCKNCTHSCDCREAICFQSMHLSEARYEKWSYFHEKEENKTKSEKVEMYKTLPPLSKYPKNIEDDKIYTLFGSKTAEPLILDDKKLPSSHELRRVIRETGKRITFPEIGIEVLGIYEDLIISRQATI